MITYCVVTSLVNVVFSLVLGVAAFSKDRRSSKNLTFTFLSLSVFTWAGGYFFWQVAKTADEALFFCRILSVGAIAISVTFYHFARRLVGRKPGSLTIVGYVLVGVFTLLAPTPWLVQRVEPKMMFAFWPVPGPAYLAYLLTFIGFNLMTWRVLSVSFLRARTARDRNQLRWVIASTFAGVIGGATNFFLWYDIPIPPVGNGLVAFYVAGIGYTIIRFRLLEVNYVVTKGVAYALASLPLALVFPAVFLALLGIIGDVWETAFAWLIASSILTTAAFLFVPHLRLKIDSILDRTLLRPYVTTRERLRNLIHQVSGLEDEAEIFDVCSRVVSESLDCFAVFYVRGEFDSDIKRRCVHGLPPGIELPGQIAADSVVIRLLAAKDRAIILDEVAITDPEAWKQLAAEKAKLRLELAVPVRADNIIYGVLGLGRRVRNQIFTDLHLYLLDSVCLQIGLHVRARQIERRGNQAEKLISLGTLAAGLAHELRNPLVSIKTFAALLEENAGDPDFQREFSTTVLRDVGRVESIIENVSAFATDREARFAWIRLEEVVRAAYEIARPSFVAANVGFEFEPTSVTLVRGNHNQLTQVVLNLLNNAVQAFGEGEGGKVTVGLGFRRSDVFKESVALTISDNGPGISPEVLNRLFEPFATTKDTGDREGTGGMGLGLAIVKRIIDGHSGVIRAESGLGHGTVFTILIPAIASER